MDTFGNGMAVRNYFRPVNDSMFVSRNLTAKLRREVIALVQLLGTSCTSVYPIEGT